MQISLLQIGGLWAGLEIAEDETQEYSDLRNLRNDVSSTTLSGLFRMVGSRS